METLEPPPPDFHMCYEVGMYKIDDLKIEFDALMHG